MDRRKLEERSKTEPGPGFYKLKSCIGNYPKYVIANMKGVYLEKYDN